MNERRSIRRRRYHHYTTSVLDIGSMFSNLASRLTSKLTRRNRDHLIVPTKTSSPKNSPINLSEITVALGVKKSKTHRKRRTK